MADQQILVVDDDTDALHLVGMTLERRGFEVALARSGPEALGLLAHNIPDLIILDVMMPQMDGNEVCQYIKSDPRTAHVPVVMLTARSQAASQVESLRAGADDYITKPVSPSELVARVQAVLARTVQVSNKKDAHVLSIVGARGGVGATTLAVNLALIFAAQQHTVLVDLEPGGTAAMHLGLSSLHGLDDLLTFPAEEIESAAVKAALTPHASGLNLLASAEAPLDAVRADTLLNHLLMPHELCLFDLGPGLSRPALAIARRSNTVLLALDSDRVTLAQAGRVMSSLNEGGLTPAGLKLVWVNRQGLPEDVGRVAIQSALGIELSAVIGSAPDAMYQALEHGQPLVAGQPGHAVAFQFRTLAASLA